MDRWDNGVLIRVASLQNTIPALSQCENAAERLTRWLNSIGAQMIVEQWQNPEQWPNLYCQPLPEVDSHAQGGLVLLPAHLLPAHLLPTDRNGTSQTNTLHANTPANSCIFWCISPLSKTGKLGHIVKKKFFFVLCILSRRNLNPFSK